MHNYLLDPSILFEKIALLFTSLEKFFSLFSLLIKDTMIEDLKNLK